MAWHRYEMNVMLCLPTLERTFGSERKNDGGETHKLITVTKRQAENPQLYEAKRE